MTTKDITEKTLANFWSKVDKEGDCWIWKAHLNKTNYGKFSLYRKPVYAHRFSYLIANGDFDQKLFVCHRCDNPSCVNPSHLFLGSPKDNTDDMMKKGRNKTQIILTTTCGKGHEMTPENTRLIQIPGKNPQRRCRECDRFHNNNIRKRPSSRQLHN